MGRVENKVAVVTGGAGGIGAASARMLAAHGATVVVTDLAETPEAGGEETGAALYLRQDVAREEDWEGLAASVLDRFGRFDILVNNAGMGLRRSIEDTTLAEWRRVQEVNLDSVFLGTRHGIAAMRQAGNGGSIINICSIEGLVGDPGLAAYNASKGGVRLLTKSAALHCGRSGYGIRVNSIHPGYIWTAMVAKSTAAQPDPDAHLQRLVKLHPIGRLGEPDDVAYGVLYLASDESRFVTGSELVIDGGYTAQ
ncbi:glucose 1-dehydrogenase [Xanthobacter autotrophicus]|uniref:glucose 1-dehydrogenase n=1 Tax=Xanthobacter autotrophicus TaxID=280 RepID=UPI0037268822